jgi:glyoxylase-like metal-dependent hydrolase (beta-lactamase superfamily II)
MRLGAFDLDIVSGGRYRLDGAAVFGVVPKTLWERRFPTDAAGRVVLAANCLLVRGSGYTALVETGPGEKWNAAKRALHGIEPGPTLAEGLASLGLAPEEVDAVVLSSLRFDHAGGATSLAGASCVPVFPRATLFVQEAELARARDPLERERDRDRSSYRPENWEPYAQAGRLETVTGESEIRQGLTLAPLAGHAAGMQAVRVDSGGKTAFYFADALPTSAHVPIPWTMESESYPVELLATKKRLLDRAAREGWLCVFGRDPDVPWGTVVDEVSGRRRVHPVPSGRAEF